MDTRYDQYMTMINSIEMYALLYVTAYTIVGKHLTWGGGGESKNPFHFIELPIQCFQDVTFSVFRE